MNKVVASFARRDGLVRYILLLCLSFTCTFVAWSVPAQHVRRVVTLADGSQVEATLYGNSSLYWFETDHGDVLTLAADGCTYLRSSYTHADMKARMLAAGKTPALRAPRRIGSQATAPLPAFGRPKVPVLLVSFADKDFSVAEGDSAVAGYYDRYCNGTNDGTNYRGHGSYGAIRDYFIAQSDSLFQPEFVVIGPVKLSQNYAYYGQNSGSSLDIHYSEFRNEAVQKAVEQFDVDWLALFDNRKKNQVDMVFFIFAGLGEANGGDENTIWPKDVGSSYTINKIRFASSACCNELRVADIDSITNEVHTAADGIGIMCHELSHALGLPDFYDTVGNGFGMDIWSVMDYGEYCSNGYCPVAYTAYERDFMGWRPLVTLTEPGAYELSPVSRDGIGYKVVNDENPNEYYVLESRQPTGWDVAIGKLGHGLQVTHVDYVERLWNNNSVNNDENHQHITIIAANDRYVGSTISRDMDEWLITWAGNLFPYEQNDSLTDLSTPQASVYTAAGTMHKPIYNIEEDPETGMVRFSFLTNTATSVATPLQAGSNKPNHPTYDLLGRPVGTRKKGVFVNNGKIVFWK